MTKFQPGHTGRPKGARNKLTGDFISALQADFQEHGAEVIKIVRIEEPATYLKVVASILPKELEITEGVFDGLTDDQIAAFLTLAKRALGDREEAGDGTNQTLN